MNAKVNVKPWRTCSINTECTAMSPETHTIQTTHFHRMMHWDTRSTQYILTIRQCFPLSKTHEVYRLSIGGELSSTRVRPDSDTTVCKSRLKSCIKEWEFCIWPTWAPGVHSAMFAPLCVMISNTSSHQWTCRILSWFWTNLKHRQVDSIHGRFLLTVTQSTYRHYYILRQRERESAK